MSTRQIKAHFQDGVFVPDETIELEDGCKVTLEIAAESSDQESSGSWLLELVDELHRKYPPETLEPMPTDGAMNYKHYLYGHPKVEEE